MSLRSSRGGEPLDQPSGLLPVDPPARGAQWAGWLLLAVAAAAGVFAVTFKLPETVVAPFVLVPAEGEDPVQAPLAGEIAAVLVREGQTVKAGEPLFQLRSDEIRNAHARIRQFEEDDQALAERVRRLEEAHTAALAIKDAEIVQGERELGFRDRHLATVRDLVRRSEQLARSGSVSPVELLARQLDEAESEKNRAISEKFLQQLAFQRQELDVARHRRRAEEKAEAEKIRVQLEALRAQLQDSTGDLRTVRATYDAVVIRLVQRTPGSMVATGAELGHLARIDARPRVRLLLPDAGMPRIAVGQQARLFFDAFPYQRHGAVAAHVTWVSPAPFGNGTDRRFVAQADLAPTNPTSLPLRVGMGGEGRILVGRQTLLERAREPLRGLRERLRTD
jgi:membrane fusion protein